MDRMIVYLAIVVVVVAVVAAVLLSMGWVQEAPSDGHNQPTQTEQDSLMDVLSQEDVKVDLSAPDRTNWPAGSSGTFVLGTRNDNEQAMVYYLYVYPREFLGEPGIAEEIAMETGASWFSYTPSGSIPASEIVQDNIVMNVPSDAPKGLYLFNVLVCSNSECSPENTANHYASTGFSVRVV